MLDYTKITNIIYSLEKKYDLFSLEENDIYYWKLIRTSIMTQAVIKLNNISSIHGEIKKKRWLVNALKFLYIGIINNPFLINKNIPKIILENPRKVMFNNRLIDPFTHFFLQDLEYYHVIEDLYKLKHIKSVFKPSSSTHLLLIFQQLLRILKKKPTLSTHNMKILLEVEHELFKELGIRFPIIQMVKQKIFKFKTDYFVFNRLFKNKKWEEIYIVCSYGKEPLIFAAQHNNIKVIEFQHGVIGPYHLGYHFPETKHVPYFPDRIFLFGEFWKETTVLPTNTEIVLYGYPFLVEQLCHYKEIIQKKKKNIITVISQPGIGNAISEFILRIVKELPGFYFQYKLHPGEFGRWKEEYASLVKLSKFKNVNIYEDQKPLYEMIAESKYIIGVNSTAIFEALPFKAIPILLKLSGFEYMDELRNAFGLNLFENPSSVVNFLNENRNNINVHNLDSGKVFKNISKEKV